MYNVTEPKRGFAVIINNYEFSNKDKLKDLPGGQSDTKRLCHTLNKMQFIVKEHENMKSNDISRIIKDCKNMIYKYSNLISYRSKAFKITNLY